MKTIQVCIKILELSANGEDLSPRHLKLVEMGANGQTNEAGNNKLREILEQLQSGTYEDWYFGIEGLWLDDRGFVYWQGQNVEHFSFADGNYSQAAKQAALELVERLKNGQQ